MSERKHYWTEEENNIIKNNYLQMSDYEISEILENRTDRAVHSQRLKLKLYRPITYPKNKKSKNIKYNDIDLIKSECDKRGYELLSNDYELGKSTSNIRYICKRHSDKGVLLISEYHFFEGKGCPYCGRERTNNGHKTKLTDEDDRKLCESKNFEYVKTEKVDNKYRIFFYCSKHKDIGIQSMTRGNMNRDCVKGCQYCAGKNIPEWYAKKYILENYNIELLSEFKGTDCKIKCKCLIHDYVFTCDSGELYYHGVGCPVCRSEKSSADQRLSDDEIKKRIYSINNNVKILNINEYRNYESKLKLQCLICGYEWESPFHSICVNGCMCKKCFPLSHGEQKIINYLCNNNVINQSQYIINECRDKRPLPFDHAIFSNDNKLIGLIEYMGEQHYHKVNHFGGVEKFQYTVNHDNIKLKYCNDNNIPFLRIPYWDYDNIETIIETFLNTLN